MENIKNVFVSHYNEDDEHIQNLKDLLDKKGYQLKNSSIDSTKPNQASNEDYIKQLLKDRISWAGVMVVLVGPKTCQSEWVNWEIEQANKQGKRIIGIFIQGGTNSDVPENLEKYRNALIGWNGDRIIDAIEGKINDSENPDGTKRDPHWTTRRENC
ncbi:MAG: TIR domain-containing protein [Bacteroidales bacterium]|nr:TIR domain-containing protein [Bacteroidales bacterium]